MALTCYKVPDPADLKNVFAALAAICTDSLATFGARFQARLCELETLRVHLRRMYLPHLVRASATPLCVLSYVSFMICACYDWCEIQPCIDDLEIPQHHGLWLLQLVLYLEE